MKAVKATKRRRRRRANSSREKDQPTEHHNDSGIRTYTISIEAPTPVISSRLLHDVVTYGSVECGDPFHSTTLGSNPWSAQR